ncbi:MAG: bifunctional 4-hydroxy-2-oxoglutarate aldolase/2-dehydro-3-deoxy-phosphogluconate aldolase [Candidatus Lokiarchaeota archaeon]|jgi:2-dehydro-3-deoxyphosphogluconate aldolase/(4S)-4-hydroxy-2-oxoglutarate aldolase|nr:bifunctional 4-hydroxy-2-oxoglutarate aldolase/2-dehydro-3-deoxy-phosphogluconate aldolase [Candidatus Lokiarchaeota archaeon]
MDVIKQIEKLKIIPVAVIENTDNALPLAKALIDAGLPVVEITFRTDAAAESISIIKKEYPEMLVGAGTVLKIEQVKAAVEAGSQFIVTPGFNPTIVDYCIKNNIIIVPGLNAPSFIEWGLERGLDFFKFFPADFSGGPKMLKLLSGPYPNVRFMPTGGVNDKTLTEYLKLDNVIACGGSWIVKKNLISSGNFEEIKNLTKRALSLIKLEIG